MEQDLIKEIQDLLQRFKELDADEATIREKLYQKLEEVLDMYTKLRISKRPKVTNSLL